MLTFAIITVSSSVMVSTRENSVYSKRVGNTEESTFQEHRRKAYLLFELSDGFLQRIHKPRGRKMFSTCSELKTSNNTVVSWSLCVFTWKQRRLSHHHIVSIINTNWPKWYPQVRAERLESDLIHLLPHSERISDWPPCTVCGWQHVHLFSLVVSQHSKLPSHSLSAKKMCVSVWSASSDCPPLASYPSLFVFPLISLSLSLTQHGYQKTNKHQQMLLVMASLLFHNKKNLKSSHFYSSDHNLLHNLLHLWLVSCKHI